MNNCGFCNEEIKEGDDKFLWGPDRMVLCKDCWKAEMEWISDHGFGYTPGEDSK